MSTVGDKYIKKVIVTDEHSTPQARASRLRRVRNLANLSRTQICTHNPSLNINTYKGWEIARYGGLPRDGAEKVVTLLSKLGVICTTDWLLYGRGQGPYIIPNKGQETDTQVTSEKKRIIQEIMNFQSLFDDAVFFEIEDDGLSPHINLGEYVAGVRYFGDDINTAVGHDCIVQTANGQSLVRHLKKGNSNNTYMLLCTNSQTTVAEPAIYDVEITSAAPILRHYRCSAKKP